MAEPPVTPAASQSATSATAGAGAHPNVNVQKLADKVYSLLLADVRLGLARGESPLPPTRKEEA